MTSAHSRTLMLSVQISPWDNLLGTYIWLWWSCMGGQNHQNHERKWSTYCAACISDGFLPTWTWHKNWKIQYLIASPTEHWMLGSKETLVMGEHRRAYKLAMCPPHKGNKSWCICINLERMSDKVKDISRKNKNNLPLLKNRLFREKVTVVVVISSITLLGAPWKTL